MNNEVKTSMYMKDGKEIPFNFYTNIKYSKRISFIKSVVDTVVTEKDYIALIKYLIFDYQIIKNFTDVDTTEIDESSNIIDAISDFLDSTGIVLIVKANMEEGLLESLISSVNKDIEYITGIHENAITTNLSELIQIITKKFEGIDTTDFLNVANEVSKVGSKLTADKIVDAYGKAKFGKQK